MGSKEIASKMDAAIGYLTEHPDEARYTDSFAVARLGEDLRVSVTGPDEASVITDMVEGVGGLGQHPSSGWLWRAAIASCVATLIGMRAAQEGIDLDAVEVTVDSESDDHGILGMDDSVPAGPLSIRIHVRIESRGADPDRLREIVEWGSEHCPLCEGAKRAIPVTLEIG